MGIRAEDLGIPSGLPPEETPYDPATDPKQIEVRVVQWGWLNDFPIKDGYKSHYRPREEADGDALFVIIDTPPPPPQQPAPDKAEWPTWGECGRIDPRFVARYGKSERGWNEHSLGRNRNALRWWQREGDEPAGQE